MAPIKRHEALKHLSREHHHGLLLCWKIRRGFERSVAPERIKIYVNWLWVNHLRSHFEEEEKFIFPLLGNENKLVQKALHEHEMLQAYFEAETNVEENLHLIEDFLEKHIRFEERILFGEIQEHMADNQLQQLASIPTDKVFVDNVSDLFWI